MSLGTLWVEIGARMDEAAKVLQQFGQQTDSFISEQKSKWEGLANVGDSFLKIGGALTAGLTVPLAGVGAAAVSSAEQINSAKVAFTTMLGSGEAADKMLKDLQKFAASTPFEFPDLVSAAQRMKNLGFGANEIIPTLRTIGDTVAASGKMSKESIDGITLALGQMQLKGKVSAEEMNQLSERGVDAWGALARAAGVTVPEAMKAAEKGTITAAQAIPAILAGMNEKAGGAMEAMSKTLTGQWSNFKDQITQALIPIGQSLIPALQNLLPILASVLAKVAEGATWFSQLPEPIRNAGLAIAAMAAALGPIVAAVGGIIVAFTSLSGALAPLGLTIGGLTAVIGPWVIAIGAAVAALVALGTWVYQNWDPIVATLSQAWDGLTENWTAAWNAIKGALTGAWDSIAGSIRGIWEPIAKFFLDIWDSVAPYFGKVWDAIADALTGVWDSIKKVAVKVWDGVIQALQDFLKWCEKIPGAKKLLNLDEAWKSAGRLKSGMDDASTGVKKFGDAAKNAAGTGGPVPKLVTGIADTGKAAKQTEAEMAPLVRRSAELDEMAKQLNKAYQDQIKDIVEAKLKWGDLNKVTVEMLQPTENLATATGSVGDQLVAFATTQAPDAIAKLTEAKGKTDEFTGALKTLGVQSAADFQTVADKAKLAYDAVLQSPMATQWEKDNALVKVLEAQKQAAIANSTDIPAEIDKQLTAIKSKLDDPAKGVPAMKKPFEDLTQNVSTVFTNFAQDITKSLFEGNTSWAEKGKAALQSLGQAVISSFIEPAAQAIGDFMSGVLKDLLGGNGFGGLKKSIEDAGAAFKRIFGKGGEVEEAGPAGGGPPGGGGAGGGAGAAMGGLTGWITAISGVVTAISSIIQNFQLAKMETTLNAIEHNTRYSMMYLGERSDGGIIGRLYDISDKMQWVPGLLDGINEKLIDWLSPLHDDLVAIGETLDGAKARLDEISHSAMWGSAADGAGNMVLAEMRDMMRTERAEPPKFATVTFQGDPIASQVGNEIMRQLRLQGVNLV